jgi:hypothetical protein
LHDLQGVRGEVLLAGNISGCTERLLLSSNGFGATAVDAVSGVSHVVGSRIGAGTSAEYCLSAFIRGSKSAPAIRLWAGI